jgi:hypothetical protein
LGSDKRRLLQRHPSRNGPKERVLYHSGDLTLEFLASLFQNIWHDILHHSKGAGPFSQRPLFWDEMNEPYPVNSHAEHRGRIHLAGTNGQLFKLILKKNEEVQNFIESEVMHKLLQSILEDRDILVVTSSFQQMV